MGVPIYLTPSWILVALFVTASYAGFVRSRLDVSALGAHVIALTFSLALALCVVAHEVGHTVVSRLCGLSVRRIVVFLLGGVSEIEGEARKPGHEFWIAVAGPLVSLGLAGAFAGLARVVGGPSGPEVVLTLLGWSNLVIAVFNLLPGLPLDGGRALQAIGWKVTGSRVRATVVAAWGGRVVSVLLALTILLVNSALHADSPMGIDDLITTTLAFAVSAFLWVGASRTLRIAAIGGRAARLSVGHLIRPAVYLPPSTPIAEAMRQVMLAQAAGIVVVDSDGRSRAIVREAQVSGVPTERRPWATIGDVSRPLEPGLVVPDSISGTQLLETLQQHPATEYLVVDPQGMSRGVIATVDVARALGLEQG
jgi:Zn-dependent protease